MSSERRGGWSAGAAHPTGHGATGRRVDGTEPDGTHTRDHAAAAFALLADEDAAPFDPDAILADLARVERLEEVAVPLERLTLRVRDEVLSTTLIQISVAVPSQLILSSRNPASCA